MDLIDRNRLNAEMYRECFEKNDYFSKGMQKWDSGNWIRYKVFEEILKKQPSARPKGKWIPCSERLPEEYGLYMITWTTGEFRFVGDAVIARWTEYRQNGRRWI